MKRARMILTLTGMFLIAAPLFAAAPKEGAKKPPKNPAVTRVEKLLEGLTLTDEQKAKLEVLQKELGPKLLEASGKLDGILTPEQRRARAETSKAARDSGKKPKEVTEAVDAAMKLTADQKPKVAEARKVLAELDKALREKVLEVLTPEQKQKFKPANPPKKR